MQTDEMTNQLSDLYEIHLLLHCSIESVRQSWVAMTQGDSEPDEADYDALYGIYRRLAELDERLNNRKEKLWEMSFRTKSDGKKSDK